MDHQEINPELMLFNKSRDMSAIDSVVLLGSSVLFRGKTYNFEKFKQEATEKKFDPEAFVPKGIEEGISKNELELLQKRRFNQRELVGIFPFLSEKSDVLQAKNCVVRVQFVGLIDPKTLKADPTWRISVLNRLGMEVHDADLIDLIELAPSHTDLLTLEDAGDGGKLMILKEE